LCKDMPGELDKSVYHPFRVRAVLNNIERIETMYRFIWGQPWFVSGGEDAVLVKRLLTGQQKVATDIFDSMGFHTCFIAGVDMYEAK